ncbi:MULTISPECIES: ACT domain-containing protein [Saccharopolyspora]|uniref:ACT domain-containing protein n=1 Tax=Saccharopolyspora elongata TaxID=2530387 RepID=A0A4R4Y097_9PSEU|nr:ACT domain-containing protein [Saccharopolyspora elongata]TDD37621.1 ACT domain-containing protein [Saccharopolyspora elongata]
MSRLKLRLHAEQLAVGMVPAHVSLALTGGTAPIHGSLTTGAGRTIIFPYSLAAESGPDVRVEGPFRALEIDGPLDFALTGVLAALLAPLADAEISVFTLSTFDTDWILVPADAAVRAAEVLTSAGHTVDIEESQ